MGVFDSAAHDGASAHSDVNVVIRMANPSLLVMVEIKRELEKLSTSRS